MNVRDGSVLIYNPKLERLIREILNKPTEPIMQTDLDMLEPILVHLRNSVSEHKIHPKWNEFKEYVRNLMCQSDDTNITNLYIRMQESPGSRKYLALFGLCILLGMTNIYDIGCGNNMQVGYISSLPGIAYIGIERENNKSKKISVKVCSDQHLRVSTVYKDEHRAIETWTQLFENYNEKIRFINGTYPFEICAPKNSIAILVGWYPSNDEHAGEILKALTRDFSRIILQVDLAKEKEWLQCLEKFQLRVIHTSIWNDGLTGEVKGWKYYFGSKFNDDFTYLDSLKYDFNDSDFYCDEVDLTRYMENLK